MDYKETKLTKREILYINGFVNHLLFKAEKLYGDKYDRFSIQIRIGESHLIGHEYIQYEAELLSI